MSKSLDNWATLNAALMGGDLKLAESLLAAEKAGAKRKRFLLRIHSRINKLRADQERAQLLRTSNGNKS